MANTPGFDPIIHAHNRLIICAILAAVDQVEFSALRDSLQVTDSVLSKNLGTLASVGYVTTKQVVRAARSRQWVGLTPAGRHAYQRHIDTLMQIASTGERGS